jgi:hypothetical protein
VVNITPQPRFTPGKEPPVPIVHLAEFAPEPVWTQRLEEKCLASARDRISIATFVEWRCMKTVTNFGFYERKSTLD